MIIAASSTYGAGVKCLGQTAGKLQDWHFDDRDWTIRYMVMCVGRWCDRRNLLVSPKRIRQVDWQAARSTCDCP